MTGREVRSLEDWRALCREAESRNSGRASLLRSAWAGSSITPPPSLEDPVARIPLERAAECERRAERAESPEEAERWLERSIAWLREPHPRSSPQLLRALRKRAKGLESRL